MFFIPCETSPQYLTLVRVGPASWPSKTTMIKGGPLFCAAIYCGLFFTVRKMSLRLLIKSSLAYIISDGTDKPCRHYVGFLSQSHRAVGPLKGSKHEKEKIGPWRVHTHSYL